MQRDEGEIWYTQEHSLLYLSERNSDEKQIFCVLTDEMFFRICSWKVLFPEQNRLHLWIQISIKNINICICSYNGM